MAEWLPELNRCWYVNRVVAVKRRYGLSMDAREAEAALAVLESCPSFAMEIVAAAEAEPAVATEEVTSAVQKRSRAVRLRRWRVILWNCTTTTATGASRAPRRGGTASRPCAAIILLISI